MTNLYTKSVLRKSLENFTKNQFSVCFNMYLLLHDKVGACTQLFLLPNYHNDNFIWHIKLSMQRIKYGKSRLEKNKRYEKLNKKKKLGERKVIQLRVEQPT